MKVDKQRLRFIPSGEAAAPTSFSQVAKSFFVGALLASTGRGVGAASQNNPALAAMPKPRAVPEPRHEAPPWLSRAGVPELTFGVELEGNGLDPQEAAQAIEPIVGKVDVTQPSFRTRYALAHVPDKGKDVGRWRTVPDSSLSGSKNAEVVTPPLRYADVSLLETAVARLEAQGMTSDCLAALHVHVSHQALSASQVRDLLQMVKAHEDLIFRLSGTSRRQRQFWSKPLEPALLHELSQVSPSNKQEIVDAAWRTTQVHNGNHRNDGMRYYMLGLHYLSHGHTLEFRQFTDTTDPHVVTACVDFALALVAQARDGGAAILARSLFDAHSARDAERFLDALGLVEPRFARTRKVLLGLAAEPRGFEWAVHERRTVAAHVAIGVVAGVAARHPKVPGWAASLLSSAVISGTLQLAAVGSEALGLTGYDLTRAVRRMDLGRLFVTMLCVVLVKTFQQARVAAEPTQPNHAARA